MYYYYYDPTYILVLIGFLITLIASIFVRVSYKKYKKVNTSKGLKGYEVARNILDKNGLTDVKIVETSGNLSDHYDPTSRVVSLSTDIYQGSSIASCSVAAHECGHAVQHKEGYFFSKIRTSLVPIVNFSSKIGYIAIVIGLIFSLLELAWIGVFLELAVLLFQLITLPVEINASRRALKFLKQESMIDSKELKGSKKMLAAAAMTYVASLIATILQVLRLILIVSGRDRD